MKSNLFNFRHGPNEFQTQGKSSPSFRKGLGVGLFILLGLFGVNQTAWAGSGIYLRHITGDWNKCDSEVEFEATSTSNVYTKTLTLSSYDVFKVADNSWSDNCNYGALSAPTIGTTLTLVSKGNDISATNLTGGTTYKFTLDLRGDTKTLLIEESNECKLYYASGTGTSYTGAMSTYYNMSYDNSESAFYYDVTTTNTSFYFRFQKSGDDALYAADWDTYPNGKKVTIDGDPVDANKDVSGWEHKSICYYQGTTGDHIRVWFNYSTKKTWITSSCTAPSNGSISGTKAYHIGDNISLTANADGTTPFTYQWKKDGNNLSGKTSQTLTISNCAASDAGSYTCYISNSCGNTTTSAAVVTVSTPTYKPGYLVYSLSGSSDWAGHTSTTQDGDYMIVTIYGTNLKTKTYFAFTTATTSGWNKSNQYNVTPDTKITIDGSTGVVSTLGADNAFYIEPSNKDNYKYTFKFNIYDKKVYVTSTLIQTVVTFDKNDGSGSTYDVNVTYNSRDRIVVPNTSDTTRTGYTFNHYWKQTTGSTATDQMTSIINTNQLYFINSNRDGYLTSGKWTKDGGTATFYAHWTQKEYTVVLPGGGGTGDINGSVKVKYDAASTVDNSFKAPTKLGYSLKTPTAFFANAEFTQPVFTAIGALSTAAGNPYVTSGKWNYDGAPTIYTQWVAKTYPITFDDQSADTAHTFTITEATYDAAMPAFTAAQRPKKNGYDFAGYYTSPNGQDTKCYNADGTSAYTWKLTPEGSTTLYAYWTPKTITYTLKQDDATTKGTASVTVTYRDNKYSDDPVVIPVRTGYNFTGYYVSSSERIDAKRLIDAEGNFRASISGYTDASKNCIKDVNKTIYAGWEAKTTNITVYRNYNNEDVTTENAVTAYYDCTIGQVTGLPADGYSRTGYTHKGLYLARSGGSYLMKYNEPSWTFGAVENYSTTTYWKFAAGGDLNLYSQWQANLYTITLNDGDGSGGSGSITVHFNNNDYSTKPVAKPTLINYIFDGYSYSGIKIIDAGGNIIKGVSPYTDASGNWILADNIELSADWVDNTPHTLTFGTTNGTGVDAAPGSVTATILVEGVATTISTGASLAPGTEVTFSFTTSDGTYISSNKGYTWDGWYNVASVGGASPISTTMTSYKYTMPGSDASVYGYATINSKSFTVASADDVMGSVSPTSGTAGPSVLQTITATPKDGYHFVDWTFTTAGDFEFEEGTSSTDATAKVAMKNNPNSATITANFAETMHTITVQNKWGDHVTTVTPTSAGQITPVEVTATAPHEGFEFDHWEASSDVVKFGSTTSESTTITATAPATIIAVYKTPTLSLGDNKTSYGYEDVTIEPEVTNFSSASAHICYTVAPDDHTYTLTPSGKNVIFAANKMQTYSITATLRSDDDCNSGVVFATSAAISIEFAHRYQLVINGTEDATFTYDKGASSADIVKNITDLTSGTDYTATVKDLKTGEASGASANFKYTLAGDYTFHLALNPLGLTVPSVPTAYSITVNAGTNISSVTPTTPVWVAKDGSSTITATVPTGYAFEKWTVEGEGASYTDPSQSGNVVTATAHVANAHATFTASAIENTYTITLVGATEAQVTAGVATHPSISAPSIFGKNFTGWQYDGTKVTLADASAQNTTITNATAATTVTATYERNADEYYIQGRFRIYNEGRTEYTTTYGSGGQWATDSRNIKFDYDASTGRFYKQTYMTPAELSENHGSGCSECTPYFFLKQGTSSALGSTSYMATAKSYLTTTGRENGATLVTSGGQNNNVRFDSKDNSGYATLYWDGTKIWYEVGELKYEVTFASVPASEAGTLTATVDDASITSGAQVTKGKSVVFTAEAASGYAIQGWYSDQACTQAISAAGTNTSYTISNLSKAESVYVKFTAAEVSFINTDKWTTPHIYATDNSKGAWPGTAMTNSTDVTISNRPLNYWKATVAAGQTIVFNNGEGESSSAKKQTDDLTVNGHFGQYFMADECYAAGTTPSVKPDGAWYNTLAAAQEHGLDCITDVFVTFESKGNGGLTATAGGETISTGALVAKGSNLVFTAAPDANYTLEGFFWNSDCPDSTRYAGASASALNINNVQKDTKVYARFDRYYNVNVEVASGQSAMGYTKPANVISQVGAISVRSVEAISNDKQLYQFDKWTLMIGSEVKSDWTGKDDKTYGITLHDSCTVNNPTIRINASINDAKLIANFKDRDVVTIYFVNSSDWTDVHVHLWAGNIAGTTWPGVIPNKLDRKVNGHDVYSYTFDNGNYTKAQWNCGKNSCQTVNITIDKNNPVYNYKDMKLYPSLDAVLPDPYENTTWRIMFGNEAKLLNYDNGDIWYCDLENVPVWTKTGDNWVKLQEYVSNNWTWRGIDKVNGSAAMDDQQITDYANTTMTVKVNDNGKQVNLNGHNVVSNLTLTFDQSAMTLKVGFTQPMAILTVSATEWDVDSETPLELRAYAKNATAACTYQFEYSTDGTNWTSLGAASANNVMEITKDKLASVPATLGTYQFKVTLNTTYDSKAFSTSTTKNVDLYKKYWLAVYDSNNWTKNIYVWNDQTYKTAYPGDALTEHLTYEASGGNQEWYFYQFQYPTYTHFKWNDGKATDGSGTANITFDPSKLCYTMHVGSNWNYSTNACPNRLKVSFPATDYYTSLDGSITLEPIVKYYGDGDLTYLWEITSGQDKVVLSSTTAEKITVHPTGNTGDVTVKVTVYGQGCQYEKSATIHISNGITIRVFNTYGKEFVQSDWWVPNIRIFNSGKETENHDMNNEGNGWYSWVVTGTSKFDFLISKDKNSTDNANQMTVDVQNVTASGCWIVSTETVGGSLWDKDKHKMTKTDDCGLYYRIESVTENGTFKSNKVTKAGDDLSFYATTTGQLNLMHYDEAAKDYVKIATLSDTLTDKPEEDYVQTAKFTGNGISNVEKYTGDYWLRTNIFDWNTYLVDAQKFTEFTRNPRFPNEAFNFYFVKHCAKGTLATGQVANAINDNLATFIKADDFTDANGYIPEEGGGNVRFGYCPETNYFTRDIINGSSSANFAEVYGDNSTYFNGGQNNSTLYTSSTLTDANKIWRDGDDNHSQLFTDMSNWVYQTTVYATIDNARIADTKAVIAAKYNGKWKYLLGYDEVKKCPTYACNVLGATSTKNITYEITLIYDFKTNRLVTAWTPSTMTIDQSMEVDADVMFLRHENRDVAQITIANTDVKVNNLNSVVFCLEFDRDTLENQEGHYWFSLPFDCKLQDVYGVEGYMDVWGIQRYNGEKRSHGWYKDDDATFWTWVDKNETLNRGEGYVLHFDKQAAATKNLWKEITIGGVTKSILRIYFPSKDQNFTMSLTDAEALEITYPNVQGRTAIDSNWKLLGMTSYNNITINTMQHTDTAQFSKDPAKFLYIIHDDWTKEGKAYGKYELIDASNDFTYRSFNSYMTQFAGTIKWQQFTQAELDNTVAARRVVNENEIQSANLHLSMTKAGALQDYTYIKLLPNATTGYDRNLDLVKIRNSKYMQLYSMSEGDPYAGSSLPVEDQIVPLAVNLTTAGEYTFAMPDGTDGVEVYLVDNVEGTHTDLSFGGYTVNLNAGLYDSRFSLEIKVKKLPTSTEMIDANGDKLIKYIRNEKMFILRDGVVYDAQGRKQ